MVRPEKLLQPLLFRIVARMDDVLQTVADEERLRTRGGAGLQYIACLHTCGMRCSAIAWVGMGIGNSCTRSIGLHAFSKPLQNAVRMYGLSDDMNIYKAPDGRLAERCA